MEEKIRTILLEDIDNKETFMADALAVARLGFPEETIKALVAIALFYKGDSERLENWLEIAEGLLVE